MIAAVVKELAALAYHDQRMVLLVRDRDRAVVEGFVEHIDRGRLYACGNGEHNMVSMAQDMTKLGLRPVCFARDTFFTDACVGQVRALTGPVVLVSLVPPEARADIALVRTVPAFKIAVPTDPVEAVQCLRTCIEEDGPTYVRLGPATTAYVRKYPDTFFQFRGWKSVRVKPSPVTVICCGPQSARLIPLLPNDVDVYVASSVSPLDADRLGTFHGKRLVVTVEDHGRVGGLGSAVLEWLSDHHYPTPLERYGLAEGDVLLDMIVQRVEQALASA